MPTYGNEVGYFKYVDDESAVYSTSVPQNSYMYFMHKTKPIMYVKSVNMFNQQSVEAFSLNKMELSMPQSVSANSIAQPFQPQVINQQNEYVTKNEIAEIVRDTIRQEMRNNKGNFKKKQEE